MASAVLTISPVPPFVGASLELDLQRINLRWLEWDRKTSIPAQFLVQVLERVLADQYGEADGGACGGWSRDYPRFMDLLYGENGPPPGVAHRDSITFSAWIGTSLIDFLGRTGEPQLRQLVEARLSLLRRYLLDHSDPTNGGLGLFVHNSQRERSVHVGLRHSAWGLDLLTRLGMPDGESRRVLLSTAGYLAEAIIGWRGRRSITTAALHHVLTVSPAAPFLPLDEATRLVLRKGLEAQLVAGYDRAWDSWDTDADPPEKAAIANALYVLTCISPADCVDPQLAGILRQAARRLAEEHVPGGVPVGGIPLIPRGDSDVGASLQFLWCAGRNSSDLKVDKGRLRAMERFVLEQGSSRSQHGESFPWLLSFLLRSA